MKFRKYRITTIAFAVVLTASLLIPSAYATAYNAEICQGNTTDVGDCRAFFSWLKQVPNGNTYTIWNYGWLYNNGNSYALNDRATAQNLIDAGSCDVLYWSGHGASNPLRLNVTASTQGGNFTTINIPSTLQVNTSNWANTCVWKNTNLKAVIFSACKILDNSYGDCKYLVRAMKASNIRVIAGYHMTSPTNPTDTNIANSFFSNATNGGVSGGESIRSSWQTANELNSASSSWAVLCYKDNYNQYYRIPGFPGNTYSAPSSTASVYRFWCNYTDPTGGQVMSTLSLSDKKPLPLELRLGDSVSADYSCLSGNIKKALGGELFVSRELNDNAKNIVNEKGLQTLAESFIKSALNNKVSLSDSLMMTGTIKSEKIDEEDGAIPDSETVVGKTFCYNNQYNGIRIEDNFIKVGTDPDGIYFVVNKWKEIGSTGQKMTDDIPIITPAEAEKLVLGNQENVNVISSEELYAPTDENENIYRLCYKMILSDGTTTYVDCENGSEF